MTLSAGKWTVPVDDKPRRRFNRENIARFWLLIVGGAFVALIGSVLGIAALTSQHALAMVTHQGPCVNNSDAGLVCTEDVTYVANDGKTYRAQMQGVHPDEVHGPPSHRTLAITYTSGNDTSPSTDDMPNAVPIGVFAGGAALLGWGLLRRRKARRSTLPDTPEPLAEPG